MAPQGGATAASGLGGTGGWGAYLVLPGSGYAAGYLGDGGGGASSNTGGSGGTGGSGNGGTGGNTFNGQGADGGFNYGSGGGGSYGPNGGSGGQGVLWIEHTNSFIATFDSTVYYNGPYYSGSYVVYQIWGGSGNVVFSSNSNSCAIAATEAKDTASFSAGIIGSLQLGVTDIPDLTFINITAQPTFVLSATDGVDVAAFSAQIISTCSFAVTEAADTAVMDGSVYTGSVLTGIMYEAIDVAAFTADVPPFMSLAGAEPRDTCFLGLTVLGLPFGMTITEPIDVANIGIGEVWIPVLPSTGTWMEDPDWIEGLD